MSKLIGVTDSYGHSTNTAATDSRSMASIMSSELRIPRLIGVLPLRVSKNNKFIISPLRLTFSIVTFTYILIAQILYVRLFLSRVEEEEVGVYGLVNNMIEFAGLYTSIVVALFCTLIHKSKFNSILGWLIRINKLTADMNLTNTFDDLEYPTFKKCVYAFPLIATGIYDVLVGKLNRNGRHYQERMILFSHFFAHWCVYATILQYSILVHFVQHHFKQLNKIMRKMKNSGASLGQLEVMSEIHDNLISVCNDIIEIHSSQLIVIITESFIGDVNNVHKFIRHGENAFVVPAVWFFVFLSRVVFMVNSSSSAAQEAEQFDWALYRIMKADETHTLAKSSKLSLHFLKSKKVCFDVKGYFPVNNGLLGKVIAGIVTYVFLLPQIVDTISQSASKG